MIDSKVQVYIYKGIEYNTRLECKEAVGNSCTTKDFNKMVHWGIIEKILK